MRYVESVSCKVCHVIGEVVVMHYYIGFVCRVQCSPIVYLKIWRDYLYCSPHGPNVLREAVVYENHRSLVLIYENWGSRFKF